MDWLVYYEGRSRPAGRGTSLGGSLLALLSLAQAQSEVDIKTNESKKNEIYRQVSNIHEWL